MSWDGKANYGLLVRNPLGWLVTKIDSNFALYKDNGVRYIRKIMVALRPGRENHEFIDVCDNIAQFYGSSITLVRVSNPQDTQEMKNQIKEQSQKLIADCACRAESVVIEAKDPVKAIVEASSGFDLLITGTPRSGDWRNILWGSGRDKFAENAACSVLRLTMGTEENNSG